MRIVQIRLFLLLLFCGLTGFSFGQYAEQKKLRETKLAQLKDDTNKVFALCELSHFTVKNNFLESYTYGTKAIELASKLGFLKGKIEAYNRLGDAYWYHTDYVKAQDSYYKAYKINDSIKDETGIAYSLYNVGWIICLQQKNYKEVTYLYKSLALFEKLKDPNGISKLYNALGNYYSDLNTNYHKKVYFDSALYYYNTAIDFDRNAGMPKSQYAIFYGNIGDLMAQEGDYKSAKFYAENYADAVKNSGDSSQYYLNSGNIARYEFHLGNTDKAIQLYKNSLHFLTHNDNRDVLINIYSGLRDCYDKKGDIENAYKYFRLTVALDDSINKQLYSSNLNDIQNSFEIDKREADIRQLKQQNEIQELKGKQNRFILLGVVIVLLIIIVIAYLLYKQNKEKNTANILLQEQNSIIIQKKQEIDHSIQYAKGIQMALLPDINDIKKTYPESFIYYLPKDVVSGDFYWFHNVGDYFYCAAADCTGHGVPGALMSIVSMDKIIQAIFEKKLTEPKDILKFLNVEIKKALKQHNDETKQRDGLDIALVRINTKTNSVDFASANRPLYIISNNKLTETKTDKVAIAGFTPDEYDFKQLSLKLNKGDCLYIATDGYADQFGGQNGKKFMTKNFKSLLEQGSAMDMKTQESKVINSHTTWKEKYEQVDDILVIGIKI